MDRKLAFSRQLSPFLRIFTGHTERNSRTLARSDADQPISSHFSSDLGHLLPVDILDSDIIAGDECILTHRVPTQTISAPPAPDNCLRAGARKGTADRESLRTPDCVA